MPDPRLAASGPTASNARSALAQKRRMPGQTRGHARDSRSRTRAACWKPAAHAKAPPVAIDPRRTIGQAPRSCRDRSTVFAIALQLLHQLVKGHHRMAGRGLGGRICRRRQPPLADPALEKFVLFPPWRHDLDDNAIAVGDHHCFAGGRQADEFAERLGKNSDEWLHHGLASFETRPLGAPQDEATSFDGIKRIPHPEEAAKAAVSKDARRRSSQSRISCPASQTFAPLADGSMVVKNTLYELTK